LATRLCHLLPILISSMTTMKQQYLDRFLHRLASFPKSISIKSSVHRSWRLPMHPNKMCTHKSICHNNVIWSCIATVFKT
uniref:Ovule protein n=1 Tax=Toxocara canis TaxID=6265 RepID=A0A183U7T3_TOXCA